MIIEYLSWSADRDIFVFTMTDLVNPVTQAPLAAVDADTGALIPSEYVRVDEIGPVVKTPAVLDEAGDIVTPAVMVEGHHVNLVAYGALADVLQAGGGWQGIFPLLGDMTEVASEDGVPPAWQGTSGMKIYEADAVNSRARVWA
jgi:hypothetical protein